MSDFLPSGYEVPKKSGSYMKFEDGVNKIRILGSPIIGYEYWNEDSKGVRKPIRKRMTEALVMSDIQEPDKIKHFWAMPVWNYQDGKVQVLEITQKGIQTELRRLAKDEDWGSPLNYDVVITKTGEKLETKYSVQPKPAKPLDEAISKIFKASTINLEALFEGGDPFKSDDAESINI